MSSYPEAPTTRSTPVSVARPATLMVALGAAVVAALAAIINGVMIVADTAGIAIQIIAEETGVAASEVEAQLGGAEAVKAALQETDDYQILRTRAFAVLISGALLLIFGLLMRKGALWARILVTISALATAGFSLLIALKPDEGTSLMVILGWVGVLVSLIALVTAWMPANGRYAKALR